MVSLITFLLCIGFFVFASFCPTLLCGYNWSDLLNIMNDTDTQTVSKFMSALGISEGNITQEATKYCDISCNHYSK